MTSTCRSVQSALQELSTNKNTAAAVNKSDQQMLLPSNSRNSSSSRRRATGAVTTATTPPPTRRRPLGLQNCRNYHSHRQCCCATTISSRVNSNDSSSTIRHHNHHQQSPVDGQRAVVGAGSFVRRQTEGPSLFLSPLTSSSGVGKEGTATRSRHVQGLGHPDTEAVAQKLNHILTSSLSSSSSHSSLSPSRVSCGVSCVGGREERVGVSVVSGPKVSAGKEKRDCQGLLLVVREEQQIGPSVLSGACDCGDGSGEKGRWRPKNPWIGGGGVGERERRRERRSKSEQSKTRLLRPKLFCGGHDEENDKSDLWANNSCDCGFEFERGYEYDNDDTHDDTEDQEESGSAGGDDASVGQWCDCAECLDRELEEIRWMIGQQEESNKNKKTNSDKEQKVSSVSGVSVVRRKKAIGTRGWTVDEEFEQVLENGSRELQSLAAMVTGGTTAAAGGGISGSASGGYSEMSTAKGVGTAVEKSASVNSVEGQLNALLSSGGATGGGGGGIASNNNNNSSRGGVGEEKRHTNLIENQLLTLEDQFWKSASVSKDPSEPQQQQHNQQGKGVQVEESEETALLVDQQQTNHQNHTTMSDSTPVKRTMKVVSSDGVSSSVVVLEDDPGGGGGASRLALSPSTMNLSRMKRFEQFLKSLVGKKSTTTTNTTNPTSSSTSASTSGPPEESLPKSLDFSALRPKLMVTREEDREESAAETGTGTERPHSLRRPSFGSMSSLNSAVQQKFLNILPTSNSALTLSAAKRNLSVNNLTTIPERRPGSSSGGGHCQGHRHSGVSRRAQRPLKSVSCSLGNFEHLGEVVPQLGIGKTVDTGESGMGVGGLGEEGGVEERLERRDSLHSWRLKVSKSTNHLQSMMMGLPMGPTTAVRPLNRFRNSFLECSSSSSQVNLVAEAPCSRCSSILSLAGGTMVKVRCSDSSVTEEEEMVAEQSTAEEGQTRTGDGVDGEEDSAVEESVQRSCKLCLGEVSPQQFTGISQCRCTFCTDCMRAYIEFEILEGAYEISCPDAMCPSQGVVTLPEIAALTTADLMLKHKRYRLNREVELDKNRTWCPRAGCDTVCLVESSGTGAHPPQPSSSSSAIMSVISASSSAVVLGNATGGGKNAAMVAYSVRCPTCEEEFCSACKKTWHPRLSCEENMKKLAADGHTVGIPFDSDLIKCCPMCGVPIEKDEGCAQMMCKRCKHVFCWYCLASLDDDFLLRHYDKGPCKNKLGHSRASVVWHRAQVIGIFAGFGILLLVASPLLLLAAPCIVCCKCRICSGGPKIEEEHEIDFDDPLTLQR